MDEWYLQEGAVATIIDVIAAGECTHLESDCRLGLSYD
jgi:hypothetical protein